MSTKIIIPHHIKGSFISAHPEWTFIYSHDYLRKGAFGQCIHFIDQPNAFHIPTMYKYCANPVYFQDCNYDEWVEKIAQAFATIPRNNPVIPCPKMGLGCSRLKEFAPRLFMFLQRMIEHVQYDNIEINYLD